MLFSDFLCVYLYVNYFHFPSNLIFFVGFQDRENFTIFQSVETFELKHKPFSTTSTLTLVFNREGKQNQKYKTL